MGGTLVGSRQYAGRQFNLELQTVNCKLNQKSRSSVWLEHYNCNVGSAVSICSGLRRSAAASGQFTVGSYS